MPEVFTMKKTAALIRFAGSQLGETRHVCAFFSSDDEEYQQNPFFVPPREFLGELQDRRARQATKRSAAI
jgi:hypothetical protein